MGLHPRDVGFTERVGAASLLPPLRAFLFKNGVFIKESSAQLAILKAGFEQRVHRAAQQHGFLYGLAAVALAILTGWAGRVIFRKD